MNGWQIIVLLPSTPHTVMFIQFAQLRSYSLKVHYHKQLKLSKLDKNWQHGYKIKCTEIDKNHIFWGVTIGLQITQWVHKDQIKIFTSDV